MKIKDEKDPLEVNHSEESAPKERTEKEDVTPEQEKQGPDISLTGEEQPEPGNKSTVPEPTANEESEAEESTGTSTKSETPETETSGRKRSSRQSLIDDHEEKASNDSYDDDLDKDEEEPQPVTEDEEEAGLVNYSLLSKEDMVKLMREKLDNPGKGNIRREMREIRDAFQAKVEAELEEKKKHFLDQGGNLEDFKPAEEPSEAEMRDLLGKYRELKAEISKQQEKSKQENLARKQEILEEFRVLMEGQESFEITFRKFKDLQRQWFAAGIVPQQNLDDLWDSYNYFVDKFNDYVRINRELRALDLKKNLELKVQLCERTEQLDNEPNVMKAFKTLQKFHTRWREIGPVPRENRDEVWERFKKATSLINHKHQEYHSKLKESLHENLEKKTALCEQVEAIASKKYDSHIAWVEMTNQVLGVQKTWKTIGYAPKKDNNAVYARFRSACDVFFASKAEFYSAAYEEQKDNLRLKTEIVEKAESLMKSEDWKGTTTELIRLQRQWKEIGPVPRRDSDKLWKRFRSACDSFFNNKTSYFEDVDSTFDDNLKAKESLIEKMDAFKPSKDQGKNLYALSDFQNKFDEIGFVPSAKKDWIKDQFRKAQDRLLEKIGLDESERSIFRFRNRISGMLHAPRSEMKLNFERDKLISKLQQLRSDITVWENNIGYFTQTDPSDDTLRGLKEKIESSHERIRVLETKIRILDDMENAN
jgi:hypothetical protein